MGRKKLALWITNYRFRPDIFSVYWILFTSTALILYSPINARATFLLPLGQRELLAENN
jgi:hypothetical protein